MARRLDELFAVVDFFARVGQPINPNLTDIVVSTDEGPSRRRSPGRRPAFLPISAILAAAPGGEQPEPACAAADF